MSLLDRVFAEPELVAAPPVCVDVGAAGGVHPAWRRFARHAIGVGFEPDPREAAPLAGAATAQFRRWTYCPGLAVPTPAGSTAALHLTRSAQCSSTLPPSAGSLQEWLFADFFTVERTQMFAATTLHAALASHGVDRIDWLKCDTQGLDLKLFQSLPAAWRERLLAVEFEPGLIRAYEGEDRLADVLAAMDQEPFWLAALDVGRTVRGRPGLVRARLGAAADRWARRLAPSAPAWVNVRYLRDPARAPDSLDRRAHLLSWVFATVSDQPGQALTVATLAAERFGGGIFETLAAASAGALRRAMMLATPGRALAWLHRVLD